jgi:hypothetical protein
MAKAQPGTVLRYVKKKPSKSERNRPGRRRRKPYRGQGKP